jgi:hypothetical protein
VQVFAGAYCECINHVAGILCGNIRMNLCMECFESLMNLTVFTSLLTVSVVCMLLKRLSEHIRNSLSQSGRCLHVSNPFQQQMTATNNYFLKKLRTVYRRKIVRRFRIIDCFSYNMRTFNKVQDIGLFFISLPTPTIHVKDVNFVGVFGNAAQLVARRQGRELVRCEYLHVRRVNARVPLGNCRGGGGEN